MGAAIVRPSITEYTQTIEVHLTLSTLAKYDPCSYKLPFVRDR